jgi:hypothetical protein
VALTGGDDRVGPPGRQGCTGVAHLRRRPRHLSG